jgi:PKD repeat protein
VGGDQVVDQNLPPVIHGVEVSTGPGGLAGVVVDASDPEGGQLTYALHWGDEADAEALEALADSDGQHTYAFPAADQPYDGLAVVTDVRGAQTTAPFSVAIEDIKTNIRDVTVSVLAGGRVLVTVSATDADTNELSYAFDMNGDGDDEIPAQADNTAFYTYPEAGEYDVVVHVTDPWSGVVTEGRHHFTLPAWEDEVPIGTDHLQGVEGQCMVFRIAADGLSTKVDPAVCGRAQNPDAGLWQWDFGDGSSATGSEVGHVFADDGVYTMTVTGGTEQRPLRSSVQIFVSNAAPAFVTQPAALVEAGTMYTYDVELMDPGQDELQLILDDGPEGMTLTKGADDRHWQVTWLAPEDKAGTNVNVALRAIDGHTANGTFTPDNGSATQRYQLAVTGDLHQIPEPVTQDGGVEPDATAEPDAAAPAPDASTGGSQDQFTGSSCNCDFTGGAPTGTLFLLGLLGLVRPRRRR